MSELPPNEQGVAIVGLAGRFPGAPDAGALWRRLRRGEESIERFAPEAVEDPNVTLEEASAPGYVRARGVLDDVDRFDAPFFGYGPREAEILDPQLRIFLETAWHALEDAGYAGDGAARARGLTGVYAGAGSNTYAWNHLARHPELARALGRYQLLLGNEKDFLATSVSFRLDLRGPSLTVQTACSTSLVAVHLAALSLASFDCDLALAGGVAVQLPQRAGYRYEEGGILSPDGCCRAFDAEARGMVGGSGVGVVVLKRLADALADGDSIRAVLLGSAVNNDGALKVGYTAPSLEGQAEAIAAAQAVAGVDPESVTYVEAHGTGTPLGDPIEVAALTRVFRASTGRRGYCALGSVKTNLGHLDAAAGVTGLIKAVLALEHGEIPPSLHFRRPNPRLELDQSPFYVPDRLVPWERGETPRRAGVSSFGIGGTNAHVVLEEAPSVRAGAPEPPRRWQVLPLSAREPEALDRLTARLADHLAEPDGEPPALCDAAFTLQVGRGAFDHRRVALARDAAEAAAVLRGAAPEALLSAVTTERERPVHVLIPGQGGRLAGLGRPLYETEPVFRAEVDRCAEALAPHLGLDLRRLLFPDPNEAEVEAAEARLAETRFSQPALFALSWASARLWASWGVEPAGMLGHSVGELVAACLGGLFDLEDALALVAERGRLMHGLPPGAMAAVELSEEAVAPFLGEADGALSLAAVNAPEMVTVSGRIEAIEALGRRLSGEGVTHRRLRTAHAFHSPDVDGVAEELAAAVERLPRRTPERRWVSSLTGEWIDPEEVCRGSYWARHLRRPVRFARGLETLLADSPAGAFLEVGPGRSLGSLLRRHPEARGRLAVATLPPPEQGGADERDGAAQRALAHAVARLWLAGARFDWESYAGERPRHRVPLPGYPFARRRYWIEGARPLGGAAPVTEASPPAAGAAPSASPEPASAVAGRHPRPDLAVAQVAPRDEAEAAVAEIWEELLGVDGVGVHDDFFELGGHSLLALRLAARLEERFGVALGTSAVGARATVARQAERLRADGSTGPGGEDAPPLLPLNETGRRALAAGADGEGPVLALVHPVGGGVLAYRELAGRLEQTAGVGVLGLRAPGHEAGEAAAGSVEELADRHLETLRSVLGDRLDGPAVRLGGWSFGGVVAFEMGRRLAEAGGAERLLFVLDGAPSPEGEASLAEADLVRAFAHDLFRAGEVGAPGPAPEALAQLSDRAGAGDLDGLLEAAREAGLLPAGAAERVRRLFEIFRVHAAALAAHRPRPWPAEMVLVEAAGRAPDAARPRDLWRPFVTGRLEVSELSGDHYSILSPPAVDRLAGLVAAALREEAGAARDTTHVRPAAQRPRR